MSPRDGDFARGWSMDSGDVGPGDGQCYILASMGEKPFD